jgi:hypothetical protein
MHSVMFYVQAAFMAGTISTHLVNRHTLSM